MTLLALASSGQCCEDFSRESFLALPFYRLLNCLHSEISMKKCRRCAKPATLHITEIRNGNAGVVHLCETCAREYLESTADSGNSASGTDLASKLEELIAESEESPAACPNCGISFNEFRESGRFGCPHDYSEFLTELLPLLENIHEDTTHIGKKPRSTMMGTQDQAKLIQLRNEQRLAIETEDYEAAARLRDEIAAMEQSLRSVPTPPAPKTRGRKKAKPETDV